MRSTQFKKAFRQAHSRQAQPTLEARKENRESKESDTTRRGITKWKPRRHKVQTTPQDGFGGSSAQEWWLLKMGNSNQKKMYTSAQA
jgi:hypothetical protein